jgi:hypothetical protein
VTWCVQTHFISGDHNKVRALLYQSSIYAHIVVTVVHEILQRRTSLGLLRLLAQLWAVGSTIAGRYQASRAHCVQFVVVGAPG